MGELAEIFKQADKELKCHFLKTCNRRRKSHNFRGAIIHYLIGHSKCENLNGNIPLALYNMIFDTDLTLTRGLQTLQNYIGEVGKRRWLEL